MADESPSQPRIEPPKDSGWTAHGPYGLQRFQDGDGGHLLRLDEALHWMTCELELPRKRAVYSVFSPLVQLDEADGRHRRTVLYMLNGNDYAYPLALGDRLNPQTEDVWGQLQFSYWNTNSQGTVREIADLWDESWPGYVQNPDGFYRDGWVAYCKTMQALAKSSLGVIDWHREYRNRYYMGLESWKERCQNAVHSLSRLAVPFTVAHELWGWGTVAAPATLADTVPAAPPAVLVPDDVKDYETLVRYRQQFLHLKPQKRPKWLPKHIEIASDEVQARGRGGKAAVAKELGYPTASGLNSVFAGAAKRAERDAERAKASAFSKGLGQRSKAA